MNVYVIYEDNGYGGSQVSKIFAHKQDLRDYLIKKLNIQNTDNEQHVNRMMNGHYETHELIGVDID
jgi:hypothetical protein